MSEAMSVHCLLISRPRMEWYPPSMHQAAILAEHGFRVTIADQCCGEDILTLSNGSRLPRFSLGSSSGGGGKLKRVFDSFKFMTDTRRMVAQLCPDWLITYDPEACFAVGRVARAHGGKVAWHFHETPIRALSGFNTARLANDFVFRNPKLPDLIVFPDPHRAAYYAAESGLDVNGIKVVMNCTRLLRDVRFRKENCCHPRIAGARLVVYSGNVGTNHGLEVAIRSMPGWPQDVFFVIRGRRVQAMMSN